MNYFSSNLKFLIKRFKTSQQDLALYIDMKQTSVSNWINGVSTPDIDILVKIHQFFGVSMDSLLKTDLQDSGLITDEHVEEFKRRGKPGGKVLGGVQPLSRRYFDEEDRPESLANEQESIAAWAIMGQLKQVTEKLDQLQQLGEELLRRTGKK